jgi:nucleotide-binding universal stress UspA family protein
VPGPVIFCYDGSEGSRAAMRVAAGLVARPAEAVVLTLWQPVAVRLAMAGAFGAGVPSNEGEIDVDERSFAAAAAEEGARRATEHGYDASPLAQETDEGVARTILQIADERDARLIVCGQRGRGPLRSALLGSVSHALASHAKRPVLIAPEHHRALSEAELKRV